MSCKSFNLVCGSTASDFEKKYDANQIAAANSCMKSIDWTNTQPTVDCLQQALQSYSTCYQCLSSDPTQCGVICNNIVMNVTIPSELVGKQVQLNTIFNCVYYSFDKFKAVLQTVNVTPDPITATASSSTMFGFDLPAPPSGQTLLFCQFTQMFVSDAGDSSKLDGKSISAPPVVSLDKKTILFGAQNSQVQLSCGSSCPSANSCVYSLLMESGKLNMTLKLESDLGYYLSLQQSDQSPLDCGQANLILSNLENLRKSMSLYR